MMIFKFFFNNRLENFKVVSKFYKIYIKFCSFYSFVTRQLM